MHNHVFQRSRSNIHLHIFTSHLFQPLQYGSAPQEVGLVQISDDFDGAKSIEYFMDLILTCQQCLTQPKPPYHYSLD